MKLPLLTTLNATAAAAAALMACSDERGQGVSELCGGRADDTSAPEFGTDRSAYDAGAAGVTLSGYLTVAARLDRLVIGGQRATGTTPNFKSWTVALPAESLRETVDGSFTSVPAYAVDVCSKRYELSPIQVGVTPLLTDQIVKDANLDVVVEPRLADLECFVPSNSSVPVDVTVTARPAAAGFAPSLTPYGGLLVPSSSGVLRLSADGSRSELRSALLPVANATSISVSVALGSAYKISPSLSVAGAPVLTATPASVKPGRSALVRVETNGQLHTCGADGTGPSTVRLRADGAMGVDLTSQGVPIAYESDAGCSDARTIDVSFSGAALPGSSVVVWCVDKAGQRGSVSLIVPDE